ncbi:MAG: 3-deoxy-D-manno-octulosonic acid transferase [Planctomycetaceae bacterium]|nr:3-deoxy-D-manno-octulosonic acid transferase [Planctomycetaceae bacterium]
MGWFLNAAYLIVVLGFLPRLAWQAWRHGKYLDGWQAKWLGNVPLRHGERPCVWLHAVSLGEVNLLRSVIDAWPSRSGAIDFVITTTTRTGYQAAIRQFGDRHLVSYCPLDFTWAVRRAIRRFRPDVLALAELELWPNLIRIADDHGVRLAVFNARLSDRSYHGYGRLSWFLRGTLRRLSLVACQTDFYADRFVQLGTRHEATQVTGSLKFDGVESCRQNVYTTALRSEVRIPEGGPIWLAGSTYPPEEQLVLSAFERLVPVHPDLRLILVPRHPERFDEVAKLLEKSGLSWARRSQLAGQDDWQVLLVDAMGELQAWWGLADIGYVGGSMGKRGGQNMIEPAAYGVAVSFGPKTGNFRDVVQLLKIADACTIVSTDGQLGDFVDRCARDPQYRHRQGQRARRLVLENTGAAGRTVELLHQLLEKNMAISKFPVGWRRTA